MLGWRGLLYPALLGGLRAVCSLLVLLSGDMGPPPTSTRAALDSSHLRKGKWEKSRRLTGKGDSMGQLSLRIPRLGETRPPVSPEWDWAQAAKSR